MRRLVSLQFAVPLALAAVLGISSCDDATTPSILASIAIVAGDAQTGVVGQALSQDLVVRVTDENGEGVPDVPVTWTAAGGSVSATAAQTDADGRSAVAWTLGVEAGAQTATAAVADLPSVEFSAEAQPDAPASITLSPAALSFAAVGDTTRISALVEDQYGNVASATDMAWTTSDEAVATVDGSGVVTSRGAGEAEIEAAAGTALAVAAVAVTQEPARVAVAPAAETLASGSELQLSATVEDGNGHEIPGGEVVWTSLDDAIAAVDPVGRVTGGLVGTAGIVAASDQLADTAEITVTPGEAVAVARSAGEGQSATVGTAVAIDPAVLVTDTHGNPVEGVEVAFSIEMGGGSTSADTVPTAADGTAAVEWTLGTAAGTNQLSASIPTGDAVTFSGTGEPGPPDALSFAVQPSPAVAGVAISPAVEVSILDAHGNLVTGATHDVTVAIGTNPSGGTLSGTATVAASGGVATFPDLWIDQAAPGYALTASSGTLTGATSASFDVSAGPADHLVFAIQPSNTGAGATISPAVEVSIVDAFENLVTGATDDVTVAIATNPSGGTLSGTTTVAAASGVATFSDLSIDQAGTGYDLAASSDTIAAATSASFDITTSAAADPATTTITADPQVIQADGSSTSTITVQLKDATGTDLTSGSGYTVELSTNAGTLSGVTDMGDGTFTAALTSSTMSGIYATVGGTLDGNTISDTETVGFASAEVCDGIDNDLDGTVDEGCGSGEDADGDGYTSDVDCNDADPTVHPGAIERADGQDNDCDGEIPAEEIDNDNDGYIEAEIDSGGWDGDTSVVGGGDCDDFDANTYPGATEIADGKDNDCDGEIDEGTADLLVFRVQPSPFLSTRTAR